MRGFMAPPAEHLRVLEERWYRAAPCLAAEGAGRGLALTAGRSEARPQLRTRGLAQIHQEMTMAVR